MLNDSMDRRGNLVLSRHAGETLVIGEARVTVVGVHGGRVTLAIDAPQHVRITRAEIEPKAKEAV